MGVEESYIEMHWLWLPLVVAIVATIVCYNFYRPCLAVLSASRNFRTVFLLVAVLIVALISGGWSDLLDIDHILEGKVTKRQLNWLCFFSFLVPIDLWAAIVWFTWEDDRDKQLVQAKSVAEDAKKKLKEAKCHRDYLLGLLEYFRGCIGGYRKIIRDGMSNRADLIEAADWLAPDKNIGFLVVDVARQAIQKVADFPADAQVVTAYFVEEDGYLVPKYSTDGSNDGIVERRYQSYREYFELTHRKCEAVKAAMDNVIRIVEDTRKADSQLDHPFTYFLNEEEQRESIQSLVCIPLDVDGVAGKAVLCLSCNKLGAFKESSYSWKFEQVQQQLETRLSLLFQQQMLLEGFRSHSLDLQSRLERQYALAYKTLKDKYDALSQNTTN